jgi:Tfp pilus assembly protein PilF
VEDLLHKAVTLDQKCSEGYLQLGVLAAAQHDDAKAIQLFTTALKQNPQLSEAHYRLAMSYDRLGERDKAQSEFQLHDELQKQQAAAVEQERRNVKQFVVVDGHNQPKPTNME